MRLGIGWRIRARPVVDVSFVLLAYFIGVDENQELRCRQTGQPWDSNGAGAACP